MKTVTTELYLFSELSETSRKVAINEEVEYIQRLENEYFSNDVWELVVNDLFKVSDIKDVNKQHVFLCNNFDFEYSLNYCQGDGFSFESNCQLDVLELVDIFNVDISCTYEEIKEFSKLVYSSEVVANNGRYTYNDNMRYQLEVSLTDVHTDSIEFFELIQDELQDKLTKIFIEIAETAEKIGYRILWESLELRVIEQLLDDDIELGERFTENGKFNN